MSIQTAKGLQISLAVLELLRNSENIAPTTHVYVQTFINCRECGLTFTVHKPDYSDSFTWCVYEHRNSDRIIINGKSKWTSFNGDLPYTSDDKWESIKDFSWNQINEAADFLAEEIAKYAEAE